MGEVPVDESVVNDGNTPPKPSNETVENQNGGKKIIPISIGRVKTRREHVMFL